jgi:hypothetical protein
VATDPVEAVRALLVETEEAHGRYEATELNGVYDEEWAAWYAVYAVEHGIGSLIGHAITADQLALLLRSSFAEFQQADPKPIEPWPVLAARRIVTQL